MNVESIEYLSESIEDLSECERFEKSTYADPHTPYPPALLTAATSSFPLMPPIPANIIGYFTFKRRVNSVFNGDLLILIFSKCCVVI